MRSAHELRGNEKKKWDYALKKWELRIKAYKKVEKLSRTMKNEEIAQILGMGKSLVEEYIRILNEEE